MSRSTDPVLPADCEQALARSDERYGSLREGCRSFRGIEKAC
jgi:hypothetical protein